MIKIVDAPAELADASLVGHKFARQQRLRDAGVSVPPFFCVVIETPITVIANVVGAFPGVGAGGERLTVWADAARHAGATQATTDTRTRIEAAPSNVSGSRGLPPAHALTTRPSTTLSPTPATMPAASINAVELITNRRMLVRGAPKAIRMPTSCVRCVTANETTL